MSAPILTRVRRDVTTTHAYVPSMWRLGRSLVASQMYTGHHGYPSRMCHPTELGGTSLLAILLSMSGTVATGAGGLLVVVESARGRAESAWGLVSHVTSRHARRRRRRRRRLRGRPVWWSAMNAVVVVVVVVGRELHEGAVQHYLWRQKATRLNAIDERCRLHEGTVHHHLFKRQFRTSSRGLFPPFSSTPKSAMRSDPGLFLVALSSLR